MTMWYQSLLCVGAAVCVCLSWGEPSHEVTPGIHPFDEDSHGIHKNIVCDMCEVYVTFIQLWFQKGKTEDEIVKLATDVCIDMKSASERICRLITREFKDEVLGVVGQLALSPTEVCSIIMGSSCDIPYNPDQWWNVSLPSTPKAPVLPPRPPGPSSPKLRVLHLTDIHIDLMYEVGSNTDCGEPVCCRSNDGKPAPGVSGAGRWGDYRQCDISMSLVNTLFEHLATIKDQFDFVIFTGDIPAHDVWNQTRSQQIAATQRLTKLFLQHLPGKQVYFCVGNHESAPVDSFPPPEVTGNNSISWLYTVLAESWGTWLPDDAKQTILKGAYYTVSPYPGFRIVSVNTNYCNKANWWLLLNRTDPADHLQWLTHVLQAAEDAKEKVFILTHIPPGKDDCLKPWSWNYYRIVNRYESTIMAQFYGHTHKDQFEVFYDDVNFTRPTNIGYVMGGITTRGDMNPSYRIYTMDGNYSSSSWAVLDFETYYTDIATANKGQAAPVWQLEYTAKSEYNMTGLYPRDWSALIYRMRDDDTVFQQFYKSERSTTMDVTIAKVIAIFILLFITLLLGIIPYFIIKKKWSANASARREKVLSLLNCFAGGVFLGACLLHLMVEGKEDLEQGLEHAYNFTGFPMFEMLTGAGFFLIAGVEQLAMLFMAGVAVTSLPLSRTKPEKYNAMDKTGISMSSASRVNEEEESVAHTHDLESLSSASGLSAFLVLIALSFHTIFDGLAVGLQEEATEVWEVFIAISIHKSLVAFCLGLQLFRAFVPYFKKPFACLCFFSLMSPIGICTGIVVTSSSFDHDTQSMASGILQGIACGTFLYVTCFEILRDAFGHGKGVMNVLVALVGFAAMAGVKALDHD